MSGSAHFLPQEIIKRKRNGEALSKEEIKQFIENYLDGDIPDYQMSALLMAIFFQKLNAEETLALTEVMLQSGDQVDFSYLPETKMDKHSTGGVGDKTSLILAPIVACCGVAVPMISGRGLGHTGGTLDKLESIPGFSTQLDVKTFCKYVEKYKLCFIGQTPEICPADKRIYALRDVTGTVENVGLITASILSKKLAEGIDGLVLDVKVGRGAFMKIPEDATVLARSLMSVAKGAGKKCVAMLTNMDQPLGRFAGHVHEVFECLEILEGKSFSTSDGVDLYSDTRELSVELSAWMIFLANAAASLDEARKKAETALSSGAALQKFREICGAQGGQLERLSLPREQLPIPALADGSVSGFDLEKIGDLLVSLGGGRRKATDSINPTIGFEFLKKCGDKVSSGESLAIVHGNLSAEQKSSVLAGLQSWIEVKAGPAFGLKKDRFPLILSLLND